MLTLRFYPSAAYLIKIQSPVTCTQQALTRRVHLLVCQLTQIGCISEKSMTKVSELLRS